MINQLTPRPSKVLFIDESYLKNVTEIGENVDPRLITTSIQYAQDRYILPILGNNIFEQWKQWIASGVTAGNPALYFDSNNLMLLEDFVQPCLAAAVMIPLVFKLNLQFKNKGVLQAHSENSTNATDKQIEWLSENYKETAAFYAQRTTNFLMSNTDIWQNWLNPQLGTNGNGADLFYPTRTAYFCGIHMPGLSTNSNVPIGASYNGLGLSILQRAEWLDYE